MQVDIYSQKYFKDKLIYIFPIGNSLFPHRPGLNIAQSSGGVTQSIDDFNGSFVFLKKCLMDYLVNDIMLKVLIKVTQARCLTDRIKFKKNAQKHWTSIKFGIIRTDKKN